MFFFNICYNLCTSKKKFLVQLLKKKLANLQLVLLVQCYKTFLKLLLMTYVHTYTLNKQ